MDDQKGGVIPKCPDLKVGSWLRVAQGWLSLIGKSRQTAAENFADELSVSPDQAGRFRQVTLKPRAPTEAGHERRPGASGKLMFSDFLF